jgi:predicted Fe-S protein YdhL (DUF1289 family)
MSKEIDPSVIQHEPVASPCIGVCVLDTADICEGCFRTMDEIARWSTFSNDGQRDIIKKTWQRAKESGRIL